ncbi:hypothetical protein HDV05_002464, partial [Chytridiales sp. JEL 0842]
KDLKSVDTAQSNQFIQELKTLKSTLEATEQEMTALKERLRLQGMSEKVLRQKLSVSQLRKIEVEANDNAIQEALQNQLLGLNNELESLKDKNRNLQVLLDSANAALQDNELIANSYKADKLRLEDELQDLSALQARTSADLLQLQKAFQIKSKTWEEEKMALNVQLSSILKERDYSDDLIKNQFEAALQRNMLLEKEMSSAQEALRISKEDFERKSLDFAKQLKLLESKNQQLFADLAELTPKLQQCEKDLNAQKNLAGIAQSESAAAQLTIAEKVNEISKLQAIITSLKSHVTENDSELFELREKTSEEVFLLKAELQATSEKLSVEKAALVRLTNEKATWIDKVASLESRIEELQYENAAIIKTFKSKVEALRQERENLQQLNRDYEEKMKAVQT